MKFDIEFVLGIFVSQTFFAAIINLVDLIKTVLNGFVTKNISMKYLFYKYSIYISPLTSFIFFFVIGICCSLLLTTIKANKKCESITETEQEIINDLSTGPIEE